MVLDDIICMDREKLFAEILYIFSSHLAILGMCLSRNSGEIPQIHIY